MAAELIAGQQVPIPITNKHNMELLYRAIRQSPIYGDLPSEALSSSIGKYNVWKQPLYPLYHQAICDKGKTNPTSLRAYSPDWVWNFEGVDPGDSMIETELLFCAIFSQVDIIHFDDDVTQGRSVMTERLDLHLDRARQIMLQEV